MMSALVTVAGWNRSEKTTIGGQVLIPTQSNETIHDVTREEISKGDLN